ncbi:hypothetical protein GCM10007285_21380 [Stappia taiwanensis]|uniref:response regulator n=1 Tax=Stappia taiwanensis TaxID=992267 RepID=UPI00198B614B|nr:response regulator [Stappia taiwanensis]GGE93504.1 hypothetical protein GCM10007285_21380 [Stappia taiwanensis]
MTVHIVEDDPGVGDALALLLRQIGHEVAIHPDAESLFEDPPPATQDTVIVDLGLPGVSGVQVIRWLSRLKTPPKIIAISGQPRQVIEKMLGDDQPAILLRKPLTEEAIVRHL